MSDYWMILLFKPLFVIAIVFFLFYLPYRLALFANRRMKDGLIKTIFFTNMASWGGRVDVGRKASTESDAFKDAFKDSSV